MVTRQVVRVELFSANIAARQKEACQTVQLRTTDAHVSHKYGMSFTADETGQLHSTSVSQPACWKQPKDMIAVRATCLSSRSLHLSRHMCVHGV